MFERLLSRDVSAGNGRFRNDRSVDNQCRRNREDRGIGDRNTYRRRREVLASGNPTLFASRIGVSRDKLVIDTCVEPTDVSLSTIARSLVAEAEVVYGSLCRTKVESVVRRWATRAQDYSAYARSLRVYLSPRHFDEFDFVVSLSFLVALHSATMRSL